jgi:hypothetical protein
VLKKFAATGVVTVAVTAALMSSAAAFADGMNTSGKGGVLSGNQVFVPISIPVVVCGNAVAVLGIAGTGCQGTASVGGGHGHH